MKFYVVHDESGEIRSIIQTEDVAGQSDAPAPILVENEGDIMTEVPPDGVPADVAPVDLHDNYRFDAKRGKLVKKPKSAKKAKPDGPET